MKAQVEQHFDDEFKASETMKPSIAETRDPSYKGSRSLTHKWKGMEFS